MSDQDFKSFEDFWPFYVREHSNKTNRTLHFIGTTLGMTSLAASLLTGKGRLALAAPLLGYGFAWVGHFGIEKNRPATFKYPLWSLRGDFRMWWKIATGAMEAEIERATQSNGVREEVVEPAPRPSAEAPN